MLSLMARRAALALVLAAMAGAALDARTARAPQNDPASETVHRVEAGETLGGIANRAQVSRAQIIEANSLAPPYTLKAGQKLIIPRQRNHVVKADEVGFDIAMAYGVPWPDIAAANGLKNDAPLRVGQRLAIPVVTSPRAAREAQAPSIDLEPSPASLPDTAAPNFAWPLKGKLRRPFVAVGGKKDPHDGIDLLAPKGLAVRASAGGKVIFAGQGPAEYGLTVILYHAGRWTTTYSYLSRVTVREGDQVRHGERIGLVGDTGLADQPQLHFEVRRNRLAQDPLRYLPRNQKTEPMAR